MQFSLSTTDEFVVDVTVTVMLSTVPRGVPSGTVTVSLMVLSSSPPGIVVSMGSMDKSQPASSLTSKVKVSKYSQPFVTIISYSNRVVPGMPLLIFGEIDTDTVRSSLRILQTLAICAVGAP
ncbi:hypothetical protein ES703_120957 [subsurface metagenome]